MAKVARMPAIADAAVQRITALDAFPEPAFIRTRYPFVMMHGFGVLASLRRGGHLLEEAMHLRTHGVAAFAPNVAPYATVPVRAAMWKERIEQVLAFTGAEKVNLIAHSMGGLDGRYLIAHLGMHAVVASLTTISTPHRGTDIARRTLQQPDRLRDWIASLCNWVGSNTLNGCDADFERCVSEMTPSFVKETFNPAVPDHPDVQYRSFAGAAGRGASAPVHPWLRLQNGLLYKSEGVNDGFVSVESARWGTFLGTIPADHPREVGINLFPGSDFDAAGFYEDLVRQLATEGL